MPQRDTHKVGGKAEVGSACRGDKEIRGASGEGDLQVAQKKKLGVLGLRDTEIPRPPAEFEGRVLEFLSSLSSFSPVEIRGGGGGGNT